MLTIDKLPPSVRSEAIRCMIVQQHFFHKQALQERKALTLDQRINQGSFPSLLRDRNITRRMQADPVFAFKIIESNLMHFNDQGHCYSYSVRRFFH